MGKLFWLLVGVVAGFAAAHVASRTPQGRALFDDLDARLTGIGAAVVDGYRAREAELRGTRASAGFDDLD